MVVPGNLDDRGRRLGCPGMCIRSDGLRLSWPKPSADTAGLEDEKGSIDKSTKLEIPHRWRAGCDTVAGPYNTSG
jgi:hypothetical protein